MIGYSNVSADFRHFEPWLAPNGLVAFHDYADYCPGVKRLVDELLGSAAYEEAGRAGTLIVLRPLAVTAAATTPRRPGSVDDTPRRSPLPNPRRLPLVSCVMPTYNRRQYVPDAIRYFMAQDYPERELLVVDDGTDPVGDLMPADERIRYLRVSKRLTIGAKRNLACEQARGEYMAHWDDDDWMASWRLRYEMDALLRERADVVGIQTLLYFDPSRERAWRYEYRTPGRAWVHDPTFCYRREVWQAERFADTNFGLDLRFLGSARRKRISVLSDYRFYVGIVHSGNTSPKRTNGSSWRTHDVAEIRSLMAADESAVDRADARSASLAPVG